MRNYVAVSLLISSPDVERSFLLMKRNKTCTTSTVSEERFSDLPVIAMHYPEILFEIDKICKASRLLFQATLFDQRGMSRSVVSCWVRNE